MSVLNTLVNFLIPNAYAETAAATPPPASGFPLMLLLGVFIIFMYLTVWRPQNKRAKEHRALVNGIAKGDEVVTAGGILGKVAKVTDQYVVIAVTDQVEITIQKTSIASVLPKGTLKSV